MRRPVHPSFGQVKTVVDGSKYGWTGKQMKEQKRFSKTIDIVSYALKSECKWCHMCVCRPFRVIRYILKFVNSLNKVNIHLSTKTCDWQ